MLQVLIVCVLIIQFIVIFRWIVRNYRKNGFAGALSGILACMMIVYCIVPILLVFSKTAFSQNLSVYGFGDLYQSVYSDVNINNYILFFINVIIGLLGLFFGYQLRVTISSHNSLKKRVNKRRSYIITLNKINVFYTICLLMGGISLFIYIYALGGITSALVKAELLRGFSSSLEVNEYLSLFKIPASMLPLAFYLSYVNYNASQKKNYRIAFQPFFSFILTALYMMINAGRTAIIILLLFIIYANFRKKTSHVWVKIFLVSAISIPLLSLLDGIFNYFAYGIMYTSTASYLIETLKILRQFSYPFQIELHCADIVAKNGLMYFKNLITDFIGLLPGVSFEQSYEATSEFFIGSGWKLVSGIPNDILSYGYLNLCFFGTFLSMMLWGIIVGFIDRWLVKCPLSNYHRDVIAFIFASKTFAHVMSADLQPIIQNDITFVLLLIFVFVLRNRTINIEQRIDYQWVQKIDDTK